MPCHDMPWYSMPCCSDQSTSLSGKPTSSLFEFCVENRYECLATHQVMLSTYLSINRILILFLVFSISYVMCGVWCVTCDVWLIPVLKCLELLVRRWSQSPSYLLSIRTSFLPSLLTYLLIYLLTYLFTYLLTHLPPPYLKPSFLSLPLIIWYYTSITIYLICKVKYSKIGLQTRANTMELRIPLDQASNK
jgi:hypothetical protein